MSDSDGTYNTLIARVTRHFASYFCHTMYVYTRGCELRNPGWNPLERKKRSHVFFVQRPFNLTSRESATDWCPRCTLPLVTIRHTRARARARVATHTHTRMHAYIYTSLPLSHLFLAYLSAYLFFFFHSSFSLFLISSLLIIFCLSFFGSFSIKNALLPSVV